MIETFPQFPTDRDAILFRFTGSGCGGNTTHTVIGNTIVVRDEIDCFCFATAPSYDVAFFVGPLAAGQYTIRRDLYYASAVNECGPPVLIATASQSLVVSQFAPQPVPTLGTGPVLTLLAVVALAACSRLWLRAGHG
jgi:hypothetical protein